CSSDLKAAPDRLRDVATNAMIMGRFEKAGALFRILGKGGDPNSLELAGRLFEGSGDLTEASKDFRYYLDHYPKASNRGQVALSLADWYMYSKNDPQAVKYFKLCFDEYNDSSAVCGSRLADLYTRIENTSTDTLYTVSVMSLCA